MPASGMSDAAAVRNTQDEPGIVASSAHESGAATTSRFSLLSMSWRNKEVRTSLPERLLILVCGSRQQVEEGVEAAIQRAAELRNRAVEGVQCQAGGRAVRERERRFIDAFQRAFWDEAHTVNERVTGHKEIV